MSFLFQQALIRLNHCFDIQTKLSIAFYQKKLIIYQKTRAGFIANFRVSEMIEKAVILPQRIFPIYPTNQLIKIYLKKRKFFKSCYGETSIIICYLC